MCGAVGNATRYGWGVRRGGDTVTEPTFKPQTLLGAITSSPNWARRRDIALATIGWIVIVSMAVWAASHVTGAILTVVVAALLAYAINPLVALLGRWIARPLAIALAYLIVIAALGFIGYLVVDATVTQVSALVHQVSELLSPKSQQSASRLVKTLRSMGVTSAQIQALGKEITRNPQQIAAGALPVITQIFGGVVDTILVIVLSIYFQIDGRRIVTWLRTRAPLPWRHRVNFLVNTFERVIGGYIRGQISLSVLVGVLTGVSMFVLGVPYALLLGVLAFLLEFIPIIGVFISGAACVALALTKGLVLAVVVLVIFVAMHIFESDLASPRLVGRAVGLHPAVSIFALLAGSELFGLWGALFASPIAGVVQAISVEVWREWKETHPEQFAEPESSGGRGFNMDVLVVAEAHAEGRIGEHIGGDDMGATRAVSPP